MSYDRADHYEERRRALMAHEGEERRKALAPPQRGNGLLPNKAWLELIAAEDRAAIAEAEPDCSDIPEATEAWFKKARIKRHGHDGLFDRNCDQCIEDGS